MVNKIDLMEIYHSLHNYTSSHFKPQRTVSDHEKQDTYHNTTLLTAVGPLLYSDTDCSVSLFFSMGVATCIIEVITSILTFHFGYSLPVNLPLQLTLNTTILHILPIP